VIKALIEERKAKRRASALRWYHTHKKQARAKSAEWFAANKPHVYAQMAKRRAARPYMYLVSCARTRSKKRGVKCDLTVEWAVSRWTGRCEVTGLPFKVGSAGAGPFSPSIDKIDPKGGYTVRNCRFVLHALNCMKGIGTDKDMLRVAKAVVAAYK
jgi:hypothetical protein